MFEEYTEEYFLEQARLKGQELNIDTRQGSLYMDAATGHCIRAAKFMADLSQAFDMLAVDTCGGSILTEKAAQDNVIRQPATPSYWHINMDGTIPDTGTRMFVDSYYFELIYDNEQYLLKSEELGTKTNNLQEGSNVMPVYNVDGLKSCTLGSLYMPGTAAESDKSLRERWQLKKSGPSQNGNKNQYQTWCESITGVGRAHIIPLYGGENTVAAVIYSTTGEIPSKTILEAVQEYIDPIVRGYGVNIDGKSYIFGDGLGDGVGNLGAHFLAMQPIEVDINVTFEGDLKSGYNKTQAQNLIIIAIKEYLKKLVLEGEESVVIKVSAIGSIISSCEAINDYAPASLKLNGGTANITIGNMSAPIVKGVVIDA